MVAELRFCRQRQDPPWVNSPGMGHQAGFVAQIRIPMSRYVQRQKTPFKGFFSG